MQRQGTELDQIDVEIRHSNPERRMRECGRCRVFNDLGSKLVNSVRYCDAEATKMAYHYVPGLVGQTMVAAYLTFVG